MYGNRRQHAIKQDKEAKQGMSLLAPKVLRVSQFMDGGRITVPLRGFEYIVRRLRWHRCMHGWWMKRREIFCNPSSEPVIPIMLHKVSKTFFLSDAGLGNFSSLKSCTELLITCCFEISDKDLYKGESISTNLRRFYRLGPHACLHVLKPGCLTSDCNTNKFLKISVWYSRVFVDSDKFIMNEPFPISL